jgi:putative hemolysin
MLSAIDTENILSLLLILGLIAANAFFVVAEYALVTARRSAIQQRAEAGARRARLVLSLMDEPVRVISTVQVGITGLGILLGAVGEPALSDIFGPVVGAGLALVLALAIVTFLSVWLGELVPKAIALHSAERVALLVARPIDLLSRFFRPLVWLLEKAASLVLRPMGIPSVSAGDRPLTREELRTVVEEAGGEGSIGAEEEQMLTGLIGLTGREVREVLVPWDDVVTVPADAPLNDASALVLTSPHTRYPALGADGQVVGVLHLRELWRAGAAGSDGTVAGLLRDPIIVPPQTQLRDLLAMMRRSGEHLAVVINEYGQMVGVATLEDILEEVVGEIEDEYDRPKRGVRAVDDGKWHVDAGISIADFNRQIGLDLPDGRDHTVGGMVFTELGRAPQPGDEVQVDGVVLRVEQVDGHRIETVTATLS